MTPLHSARTDKQTDGFCYFSIKQLHRNLRHGNDPSLVVMLSGNGSTSASRLDGRSITALMTDLSPNGGGGGDITSTNARYHRDQWQYNKRLIKQWEISKLFGLYGCLIRHSSDRDVPTDAGTLLSECRCYNTFLARWNFAHFIHRYAGRGHHYHSPPVFDHHCPTDHFTCLAIFEKPLGAAQASVFNGCRLARNAEFWMFRKFSHCA